MASKSSEAFKRILTSLAIEATSSIPAALLQITLATAILGLTWNIPKEWLPPIGIGILAIAYTTGPIAQARAMQAGYSNDTVLAAAYEAHKAISKKDHPNPYPAIAVATAKAWTFGYFTNPVNYGAHALGALTDGRAPWANFMAQVITGWTMTMVASGAIVSGKEKISRLTSPKPAIIAS